MLLRDLGLDPTSRTGYEIFQRYKDCGIEGLTDRSRRPYRHARQLPFQIEKAIVQLKQEHPSWGAPKIRERLRRKHSEIHCPAISTVHAILDRNGLVKRRRRRVYKPEGTPLAHPHHPNDLWCADYKGEFMLADRRYCYPLTITDFASRYLITCEGLSSTLAMYAFTVFERAFKDFGLPRAIRTDNGSPFASANSLFGLTKLSVWWLRLGIGIERIKPGHPQQNGRHERYPAELYQPSPRPYKGLPELEYPFHDRTITVTRCGRICLGRQKIHISQAFAGQKVGVKQVSDRVWLVSFMQYDLGYFDDETCRIESAENPFAAKLSPMSPV